MAHIAKNQKFIFCALAFAFISAHSATYKCEPEFQTVFGKHVENNDFIKSFKPYTLVQDDRDASIQRCSRSFTENKHNCENYKIDRIENDSNVLVKKYYIFKAQYDIQIFKELSYIDNNGRGGMLYGKCKLVSP
jgi:hypothetical protein